MAHLLNAITELMVKPEKENERMTLKIKKSEEVQAWETIGAEREPCKKIRGGKPKGGQLSAEQRAIMEQRFQLNQKTLRQAERLDSFVLSFFRSFVLSFFRSFDSPSKIRFLIGENQKPSDSPDLLQNNNWKNSWNHYGPRK